MNSAICVHGNEYHHNKYRRFSNVIIPEIMNIYTHVHVCLTFIPDTYGHRLTSQKLWY